MTDLRARAERERDAAALVLRVVEGGADAAAERLGVHNVRGVLHAPAPLQPRDDVRRVGHRHAEKK
eukprot:1739777-Pyramimonas_sp.AAC.1